MTEIEYRAERAKYYQEYLFDDRVDDLSGCILLGLWETAGWISGEKGAPMLKWLEPGQRDG